MQSPADARGFSVCAENRAEGHPHYHWSRPINGECTHDWMTELTKRMDRMKDCVANLDQLVRSWMIQNEVERNVSKQPTSVGPTNDGGVRCDNWNEDETLKKGNSKRQPKTSNRGPRCYNCHDCGHLGRDCPH